MEKKKYRLGVLGLGEGRSIISAVYHNKILPKIIGFVQYRSYEKVYICIIVIKYDVLGGINYGFARAFTICGKG